MMAVYKFTPALARKAERETVFALIDSFSGVFEPIFCKMNKLKALHFFFLTILFLGTQALFAFDGQEGMASWYGEQFNGKLTANGETLDMSKMTAAHKTLPFGTIVQVTNLKNNKSIEVRINDRGPFVAGRIIDLSKSAFEKIETLSCGTAKVRLKVISVPDKPVVIIQPKPQAKSPTITPEASVPSAKTGTATSSSNDSVIPNLVPQPSTVEVTYTIQLGAFSKLDNATRCRENIYALLGPVQVEIEVVHPVFRVKINKVKSSELEKIKATLWAGGFTNVIVKEELK